MVKEEILGGLRVALSKGHSLQDAMQSFFNAGYKRQDIEAAARLLNSQNTLSQPSTQKPGQPQKPPVQKNPAPQKREDDDDEMVQRVPSSQPPKRPVAQNASHFFPKSPKVIQDRLNSQNTSQRKKQIPLPPSPSRPYMHSAPKKQFVPQKTKPVVSSYEGTQKKSMDATTVILFIVLILLIIALLSVFFFRENLIEFLNRFLE